MSTAQIVPRLTSLMNTLTGLFDSHSLFQDILNNPAKYLNGTAPLNTTAAINSCVFQEGGVGGGVCTLVNGTDRDSYVWYVILMILSLVAH